MSLQEECLALLVEHNLTLAVAESCTGGYVSKLLTDTPGTSKNFVGGIVACNDDMLIRLLDVKSETLEVRTAVSKEVSFEMAQGVRAKTGADIGLAISATIGPPEGKVCFGLSAKDRPLCASQEFIGDLNFIRNSAAYWVLKLLKSELKKWK